MSAPVPFEQQYPSVGPLIIAIADWYRAWRAGAHRSELDSCTAEDIERMAADVGLSVADLHRLENTGHEPFLLPRMLAALKIDASELAKSDPAAFRDLQRVCSLCDNRRRCGRELAAGDAAATFEAFCPNALTLKGLA
jgi:hypothetical protein